MKFHLLFTLTIAVLVPAVDAEDQVRERAMLRIETISRYEETFKKATDENSKRSAEAMITVLFRELKSDFNPKDLDNYILVRVGDFLRIKTSTPRDALIYYDEVLGREDKSYHYHALQGRAEVYGLSPEAADIEKAIIDYTRLYEESEERSLRESALFRKIELLMRKKDYAKAAELAQIYLDRKNGFAKYAGEVSMLLAESFDKQDMRDDAIAMYVKIWAIHMGQIRVSSPAIARWMELMWDRNRPAKGKDLSDRQAAYESGARYIQLTTRIKEKFTEEELKQWERVETLVENYQASPEIKEPPRERNEEDKFNRKDKGRGDGR